MSSTINPGSSEAGGLLTIVIVSWNVRDYLSGCLRSLEDGGVTKWAEVVVVDNESRDGSDEMVLRDFPAVTLVRAGENLGFSRANNLAIRRSSARYVLLLNPDTVVPPGAIEALVAEMEKEPRIGAVGPRQHGRDGRIQLEGAVNQPTVWNTLCDLTFLARLRPRSRLFARRTMGWWDHLDDRDVPGIAGSAMLLRRAALEEVGVLDDTMFCGEDMDLCRRLVQAEWRVRYLGSVAITHYGGESVKRSNAGLQRQIAYQSFWLYLQKHEGPVVAAVMVASVVGVSLVGWAITRVALAVPALPAAAAFSVRRYNELCRALLVWGVTDKWEFRHALGAAPAGRGGTR